MKLSPPTRALFFVSLIIFALALAGHFAKIQYVTANQYWLAIISYALLAFGCAVKGA